MRRPCYITGTGLVTAQGIDLATTWNALLAGNVLHATGIVPIARDPTLSRVSQLAIEAARQAIATAGDPKLDDSRTALLIGTSKGPIEDWIDQLDGRRRPNLGNGVAQVAVDVAAAIGHGIGPRLTLAGACASGLHALIRAADLLAAGTCDQALVVAAEASTHALFNANFARLGVLANPDTGCRPFDRRRDGFLLAEGAAAVWLSRIPSPDAIPITATAWFADATHLTGSDPDGHALRHTLRMLDPNTRIDCAHTHGTGTPINDAVELAAIETTFGQHRPIVVSHKHALGHTQGAAGLIGVVLTTQSHRNSRVFGNANSGQWQINGHCRLMEAAIARAISSSIVIAAGFGGTIAGVRLG